MDLHPYECWLIKRCREKYQFAEITVVIHNGVPQRIKSGIKVDDPRSDEIILDL